MKYLTLLVIVLLFCGCKKDHLDNTKAAADLQVPAYTETGANTFGCLVNGKPWANFGAVWISGAYSATPGHNVPNVVDSYFGANDHADSVLYISAELTVQKNGLTLRDERMYVEIPKTANLKGSHPLVLLDYMFGYTGNGISAFSVIRNPFIFTINKDSIAGTKRIISGRFSGMLYNYTIEGALTDSLRVTGGVFDVGVKLD